VGSLISPAEAALILRGQALAALDEGDPGAAERAVDDGITTLENAGLASGQDAAALLIAKAEIEEALDHLDVARETISAAVAIIDAVGHEDDDSEEDLVYMWCQAQERLAGLERVAGPFEASRR
jgi:hypothetical protein